MTTFFFLVVLEFFTQATLTIFLCMYVQGGPKNRTFPLALC